MRDLPDFKVFPSPLIYDMHKSFDAVCANVGLAPDDRATALIVTKIVELANAGRKGDDLTVETLRFFEPVSLSSSAPRRPALERKCLAAIMHHVARFCMSVERARATDPTSWIGVRPLAVRRV